VGIVFFCVISIIVFIKLKRKMNNEYDTLTESEEKYLAIGAIRKKIRKLLKSGNQENIEQIENLQVQLAELKIGYLN
jgi:hypothetical protein